MNECKNGLGHDRHLYGMYYLSKHLVNNFINNNNNIIIIYNRFKKYLDLKCQKFIQIKHI